MLDSQFRIPGTSVRFGIDPILSLIPVLGELASPAYAAAILGYAASAGVPRIVLVRMALNALFDAALGAIPFAGSVADMFWRANNKNLALVERHAHPGVKPTTGDYLFVWSVIIGSIVVLLLPLVFAAWITWLLISQLFAG
jgi:hypothetical protein